MDHGEAGRGGDSHRSTAGREGDSGPDADRDADHEADQDGGTVEGAGADLAADGEGVHGPATDAEAVRRPATDEESARHADSGGDHGHHLPAVADWPQGFGEASWWPFVTAVGATGIYVSAGLFVAGRGDRALVDPVVGPAGFVVSFLVFLVGLYGWTYHAFVDDYWSRHHGDPSKLRWGMVLFLGTEIATFGAGFVYYFFVRVGTWPPVGAELPNLLSSLILVNTVLLVTSSFTLHYSEIQLRRGNRGRFLRWLGLTFALGLAFVGGQLLEYYEFVVGEGFTLTSGVFASAFFGLTGLHGLHVTMGVLLLGILLARGLAGQYDAERHTGVTTVSLYWHFVDAVWLFLVATIYVLAAISL